MEEQRIIVTGGAGYIGSHFIAQLLEQRNNVDILVIDNLISGSASTIQKIEHAMGVTLNFHEVDIRDEKKLTYILDEFKPDKIVHFAALKSPTESIINPLEYYDTNITGTITLLRAMEKASCYHLIFSSSAAVYGDPEYLPIDEAHPMQPLSPYGMSKKIAEQLISDQTKAVENFKAIALRYFNPIGAHRTINIGEPLVESPLNLIPATLNVLIGTRDYLSIFGDNFDTIDGTGVRDYIDILDLADGHIAAIDHIASLPDFNVFNLGRGSGLSVLECVELIENAIGKNIPKIVEASRPGDISSSYADCSSASDLLNWKTKRAIEDTITSAIRWVNSQIEIV